VKTSKAELQRRKAAAQLQDEERRRKEALIEQGDPLDDELFAAPPPSPAMQFIYKKIKGVSVEQFDLALQQASIDLLVSRVPLDNEARHFIAAVMHRLVYPEEVQKDRIAAKLRYIEGMRAWLIGRGDSQVEADNKIAEELGHNSGEALSRWVRREQRKV
jgi:hypothetical protein